MFPSPLLIAPMAGGPSTPRLVAAAGKAGALGFLAAGYRSAENLAEQIRELRDLSGDRAEFGVNLFVPHQQSVNPEVLEAYRQRLLPVAERYGVKLPALRLDPGDDDWLAKIDLLLANPVPYVSFTFGLPEPSTVAALHTAGTLTIATVTCPAEARAAAEAGIDALIAQHSSAGGHSGAFLDLETSPMAKSGSLVELTTAIRAAGKLPVIAAGGISNARSVTAALQAGAVAVHSGTAFLLAEEAGTHAVHQQALRDAIAGRRYPGTALTRAFTGRWARGLENSLIREHSEAPRGYPHLHHLTGPLRAAAAARADPEAMSLWAGENYHEIVPAPAAVIIAQLQSQL